MVMDVVKPTTMRNANSLSLLNYARQYGPVAKKDIQAGIGLSWGAISNITAELIERGALTEIKQLEPTVGRTPSLLDISSQNNLIIGIEVNAIGLTAVMLDLKCRVLYKNAAPVKDTSRAGFLDEIKRLIRKLLSDNRLSNDKIIGIGMAVQGVVDSARGVSVFAPFSTSDWVDVPIRDIIRKEFDLPVSILHDPVCSTLAEKWIGCVKYEEDFILIRINAGIGMGIVTGGSPYSGNNGNAGELEHLIVQPNGEPCTCGNKGCLGAYASGRGLLDRARQVEGRTDLTIENMAAMARGGQPGYANLFIEAGTYLGNAIAGLINILNPQVIVFDDYFFHYKDLFWDAMVDSMEMNKWKHSTVRLKISDLDSSAAIGAAVDFVQKVFTGQTSI